jgi:hypothetical protein
MCLQFGINSVVIALTIGELQWGESVFEVIVTFTGYAARMSFFLMEDCDTNADKRCHEVSII